LALNLTVVVEESRSLGKIHSPFNATFIENIPKCDEPSRFDQYRPISLCNCIYKLISNVISKRLNPILSANISLENFGFLDSCSIYDAIGITQEALHSINSKSLSSFMLKIDLSKAFEYVNWLFLHVTLTYTRFPHGFINWIEDYFQGVSYVVLVNKSTYTFFNPSRGLYQGFPLSPLLFLTIVDALSIFINHERTHGWLFGLKVSWTYISQLLFVDDILIFGKTLVSKEKFVDQVLKLFSREKGMGINVWKSSIIIFHVPINHISMIFKFLPFSKEKVDNCFKYLGFLLKGNDFRVQYWE